MKLKLTLMSLMVLGAAKAAPVSPMNNYYESNLTQSEVNRAWSTMRKIDIKDGSICSNRANVWSYEMKDRYNIDSKKLFIYYTPAFIHFAYDEGEHKSPFRRNIERRVGKKVWYYHVAPAVKMNGQNIVLDKLFSNRPQTEQQWIAQFTKRVNKRLNNPSKRYEIISKIRESIAKLSARLERRGRLSAKNMAKLTKDRRTLKLILSAPRVNGRYNIQCKPITNVAEHYFDKNSWCHVQYASMYYWNPRDLRLLNWGSSKIISSQDYSSDSMNKGSRFTKSRFTEASLKQSYKQAFGIDFPIVEEE